MLRGEQESSRRTRVGAFLVSEIHSVLKSSLFPGSMISASRAVSSAVPEASTSFHVVAPPATGEGVGSKPSSSIEPRSPAAREPTIRRKNRTDVEEGNVMITKAYRLLTEVL